MNFYLNSSKIVINPQFVEWSPIYNGIAICYDLSEKNYERKWKKKKTNINYYLYLFHSECKRQVIENKIRKL